MSSLRKQLSFYLEDIRTPLGKSIHMAIAVLVLISSGIFVAQTYDLPGSISLWLSYLDTAILVVFAIEYVLRLWSAEQRVAYFFNVYALIDLLAILPFFLGAVGFGFLRLLRWFRFLRLARFMGNSALLGRLTNNNNDIAIFLRILFTLAAIVFIFSGLIYQVEHYANPDSFPNFLDAFYFAIFTMTTVGFSNVTPVTEAGKLMAVLMVLTGIALIPVQLGELIKRLIRDADGQGEQSYSSYSSYQSDRLSSLNSEHPQNQLDRCISCGFAEHDPDAKFCKMCGSPLLDTLIETLDP
ncbi:Ion transport 2 domain protein [Thalassoporum mexicanum PCC 7367]|uniref:ion transporter n=1 Tax=Thalassoporum mexicanum TaxID=3457544 RepID=UPI00029FE448|nr:ion transporter [Pseudanabaena sp. PCC 7367]AFY69710.1 Ion transport 2 domain protein [Pseudanabaena sp. PCC 7367]